MTLDQRSAHRNRLAYGPGRRRQVTGAVPLLLLAGSVNANENALADLDTLIVTASHQPEAAEEVPNAITMVDGETVATTPQLNNLEALSHRVPGLNFQPSGQSGFNAPVMRGLSANPVTFASSTLLRVDGVARLAAQGFSSNLHNIDRVEVLRGPQSSLYGRNADGGVISLFSPKAGSINGGELSLTGGSRRLREVTGSADGTLISDTLHANIHGSWRREDGYVTNTLTGDHEDSRESWAGGAQLRWQTGPDSNVTLRYRGKDYDDGGSRWGPEQGKRLTVASGTPSWNRSSSSTWSLDLDQPLGQGVRLKSITGYNRYHDHVQQDTDFRPPERFALSRNHRFETLSQELRLTGNTDNSHWLLGTYLDKQNNRYDFWQQRPSGPMRSVAISDAQTGSLFGQWDYDISPQWSLLLGGRYENSDIEVEQPHRKTRLSRSWNAFSPTIAVTRRFLSNNSMHLRVSQGVRAGGLNVFSPVSKTSYYKPQEVMSYEWGVKGLLASTGTLYEWIVHHMNVDDMQVQQFLGPGMVNVTNAAEAKTSGTELSISQPLHRYWQLNLTLAYNDARFEHFVDAGSDYANNRLPFAPKTNAHLTLNYRNPNGWFSRLSANASDGYYLGPSNTNERKDYRLVNVAIGHEWDHVGWQLYGHNLTDAEYDAQGFLNGTATVYSKPRTLGLELTVTY